MPVPRRRTLSIQALGRTLQEPRSTRNANHLSIGALHAFPPERSDEISHGHWLTLVTWDQRLLILADEFAAEMSSAFTLCLKSTQRLKVVGQHFLTRDDFGPLCLHALGDYEVEATDKLLKLRQCLAHSRFLVALTRDVNARVRVLNGWSVEQRTEESVLQLLHANRGRQLRPLGPIQTDARFAAVHRSQRNNLASVPPRWDVLVLQAAQLNWAGEGQLQATQPFDLTLQLPGTAVAGRF